MPKIDIDNLKTDSMTGYPEPFRQIVLGRVRKRLGNAAGLTQFGVNLTTLKPGAASAQRHWHAAEDEFVYLLAGEVPGQAGNYPVVLVDGVVGGVWHQRRSGRPKRRRVSQDRQYGAGRFGPPQHY